MYREASIAIFISISCSDSVPAPPQSWSPLRLRLHLSPGPRSVPAPPQSWSPLRLRLHGPKSGRALTPAPAPALVATLAPVPRRAPVPSSGSRLLLPLWLRIRLWLRLRLQRRSRSEASHVSALAVICVGLQKAIGGPRHAADDGQRLGGLRDRVAPLAELIQQHLPTGVTQSGRDRREASLLSERPHRAGRSVLGDRATFATGKTRGEALEWDIRAQCIRSQ